MQPISKRTFLKTGYILLLAIVLLFVLRFFFIDVYRIPSESMMNKFKADDYIFINKTLYSGYFSRWFTAAPQQGGIYVFTIHKKIPGFFVKRCIGLPGSVVEVKNGVANVDGISVPEPLTVRHYYKIWFNDYQQVRTDIEQAGIDKLQNGFRRFPRYIFMALDNFQKNKLTNGIDSITIWNRKNDPDSLKINIPEARENIPDMQPLKIPFKGMTIFFDQQLPTVYESMIRTYEDAAFRRDGPYAFIAGKRVASYTFKNDYLFMMGDNRDIAIDSRHYGLIPSHHLIGKFILKW